MKTWITLAFLLFVLVTSSKIRETKTNLKASKTSCALEFNPCSQNSDCCNHACSTSGKCVSNQVLNAMRRVG